jgi:hypothetical protein
MRQRRYPFEGGTYGAAVLAALVCYKAVAPPGLENLTGNKNGLAADNV